MTAAAAPQLRPNGIEIRPVFGLFEVLWVGCCPCCGAGERVLAFGADYDGARRAAHDWASALGLAILDRMRLQ